MSEKKITIYPAHSSNQQKAAKRRKLQVAAYCRVSTNSLEQKNSYKMQKAYYTQLIASHSEWKNAGIYADRGISGADMRKRDAFIRMLNACRQGKIDLILVKSISRFARNTVDCLSTIRMLREHHIGVFFEKENINTLTANSEFLITLFSCFAQAESESLSKNVAWGIRRRMAEGRALFKVPMGYRRDKHGNLHVVWREAEIILHIYQWYAQGCSLSQIKQRLEFEQILSPLGCRTWSRNTLSNILSNEKYIGNALFQKTYTLDFISKKVCKNNGDLPMILIEHHHPAIISYGLFQQVQSERTRRSLQKRKRSRKTKIATRKFSGKYALSDRLICGECGSIYRRCVWNVSGVRRTVWRCCSRLEFGKAYCHRSPTIEEAALHRSIVSAINQYIEKQRKSPAKTPPPKPLVTDDMNYSRHISEMQSDAQQLRFDEIKSWLSAHRDGIQCYDDQAVRLLVQKITVVSKDMISVKFYGRRGKIVVIL